LEITVGVPPCAGILTRLRPGAFIDLKHGADIGMIQRSHGNRLTLKLPA
jgi:hypothetical protein